MIAGKMKSLSTGRVRWIVPGSALVLVAVASWALYGLFRGEDPTERTHLDQQPTPSGPSEVANAVAESPSESNPEVSLQDSAADSTDAHVGAERETISTGVDLSVILTEQDGTPVGGAAITIARLTTIAIGRLENLDPDLVLQDLIVAGEITRSDGSTVLRAAPPRGVLITRSADFALDVQRYDVTTTDSSCIQVRAVPTDGIHGFVVEEGTLRRIEGARVLLFPWGGTARDLSGSEDDVERICAGCVVLSDSRGRFALDRPASTRHVLWCFVLGRNPVLLDHVNPSRDDVIIRIGGGAAATGVVADDDGAPIAGVKVECATYGEFPTVIAATAPTDQDGIFRMENLPTGLVSFRLSAKGFGIKKSLQSLPLPEGQSLEFELGPEAEFRGHVVDHLGKPVAGALVEVVDRDQDTVPSRMETEPDGSFWSINVPPDHRLEVWVSKSDRPRKELFGYRAPCEDAVLVFPPTAGIEMNVVDPDGKPITEFEICHQTESDTYEYEFGELQSGWQPVHDPNGHFVTGVTSGNDVLSVRATGYEMARLPIVGAPPGEYLPPITICLNRGRVIAGRVLDQHASPVAGASISIAVQTRFGDPVMTQDGLDRTTSDAAGGFSLAQAGSGPFDLVVRGKGFGSLLLRDQRVEDFPRDLTLDPPGVVEGIVHSPWRSPETTALIIARPVGTRVNECTRPDALGRFHIEDLGGGPHVIELADAVLRAEHGSEQWLSTIVDIVPGQTSFVELSTGTGCLVDGIVNFSEASTAPDRFEVVLVQQDGGGERVRGYASTDTTGYFALGRIPIGHYVARARSRERGSVGGIEKPFDVVATQDHVTLEFAVEATGIQGSVVTAVGTALDAIVTLVQSQSGRSIAEAPTDREGHYRILLRHQGSALAWVRAPGFAENYDKTVDLGGASDQPPLEHVLVPEARVAVDVVDDRGGRVGGADVQLDVNGRPAILPLLRAQTDPSGRYTFTQLARGAMQVSARRKGYVPSPVLPFVVAEGETRSVKLMLTRCGSLDVIAHDGHGHPIAGTTIEVRTESHDPSMPSRSAETSVDGKARFADLAPGRYEALASNGNPVNVEIHPGETTRTELFVERR